MGEAHGPTMHLTVAACRTPTPRRPTVIEATSGRICRLAERPDRRKPGVQPNPAPAGWAIGRFRRVDPLRTAALSAAFGRAVRRGPIVTMGIRAWGLRGAAAGPHAVEAAGPHEEAGVEARHVAAVAAPHAVAVVDIDRSESCGKPI